MFLLEQVFWKVLSIEFLFMLTIVLFTGIITQIKNPDKFSISPKSLGAIFVLIAINVAILVTVW